VLAEYPYGVAEDAGAFRAVAAAAATRLPVVRADWFLATASRPPLYYNLLQLPTTAGELERQLRIDAAADIRQERVARAGFTGSGVSRNNRLIERHVGPHGAYWRTYDFEAVPQDLADRQNLLPDRRNLFAYPLGPGRTADTFQHAGGEVIFHLPNGLLGFLLVDANDRRIDKAPTQIVSDPRRPDRAVEPGVSCMSCHLTGVIPKADQVRGHVARHPAAFGRADAELVRALYPPEAALAKLMAEDAERFRTALERCGGKVTEADPVSAAAGRYEADLDLRTAAAEVGQPPEEFRRRVARSEALARGLGALRGAGGTVPRAVFQQAFGDLARELRLGALVQSSLVAGSLPDATGDLDPLEGPSSQANAAAVSPDRRFALLGCADRSVRLVEVATGREVRRFVGHAASVWAVAFAPDGKRALSGSLDGTARLWDVATGQELRRLDGHAGLVSAVAFAPDGRRALSAGFDHAVVVWDLDSGRELRRIDGWPSVVHSAAITPDGRRAVVGGDPGLALIDLATGETVCRFDGHAAAVVAVAAAPDGRRLASASDDGAARLWDADAGAELHALRGHAGGAKAVAFTADGRELLTGDGDGTVRRWDVATGIEHGHSAAHAAPLAATVPSVDGRQVLSVGRDSSLTAWVLAPAPAAPPPESRPTVAPAHAPTSLRPIASVELGGTLAGPVLSPDGRWLYVLDRTAGRLLRLDAATLRTTANVPVPAGAAFALARDSRGLFITAPKEQGAAGALRVLDPATLAERRAIPLATEPYDVAAGANGLVFVSGGGTGWADVSVVDAERGTVLARWGGVWARSLLAATPDGARLLTATQGVTPGRVEALAIPEPLTDRPAVTAASPEARLGGALTVTPDGRFALCPTGTVLRLSVTPADDLRPVANVGPFAAAAVAPDRGTALVLADDGTLTAFDYPAFKPRATYRLGVAAFGAALDAAAGRLYVAGIPLGAVRDRPRARGLGDVIVFDVRNLERTTEAQRTQRLDTEKK
jgi:dipeptidyl aminopeptidase/acylaminoacyl peptidase